MSSIKRILAAQTNGARSKGPVSPAGKRRSSQNATRHGLLSNHIVLRDEFGWYRASARLVLGIATPLQTNDFPKRICTSFFATASLRST